MDVRVEEVETGFVYVIGDRAPSRVWATAEKAQQAGEDFAKFLETDEVVATPVPGTSSMKPADTAPPLEPTA